MITFGREWSELAIWEQIKMIKLSIKEGQNINTIDQQEALTGGGSKIALKTDKITRGIYRRVLENSYTGRGTGLAGVGIGDHHRIHTRLTELC